MRYVVIKLKKGWAVQNTATMGVMYSGSEKECIRVSNVLNGHT